MAMSSQACHCVGLDWHMLGWITGAGVDGGLPWDSPEIWVRLRFGSAPSPLLPKLGPSTVKRGRSSLGPQMTAKSQPPVPHF